MPWPFVIFQLAASIPLSITLGILAVKLFRQADLDHNRKTYRLTFPTDGSLEARRVAAWLRSINKILYNKYGRITGVQTIAFETWTTDRGIVHRMKVPWQWGDYIAGQLRTLVPGVAVAEDDTRPTIHWTRAIEIGLTSPSRTLDIDDANDVSSRLLGSVGPLQPGETVLIQWVITPAPHEKPPAKDLHSKSADFSYKNAYKGVPPALKDELEDRRQKLKEPNVQAVARIAAHTSTEPRAAQLVAQAEAAMHSAESTATQFQRRASRPAKLIERINKAASPYFFPAQLMLSELTPLISWAIGSPNVPGLPQGPTRHLPATEDIPRAGILLGKSNYPGHERPIALSYDQAVKHIYFGGRSGMGKSTAMNNVFAQAAMTDHGCVVIDASDSRNNNETLFSRVLGYIPAHRVDDVIIMDVNNTRNRPVGFNILDQGSPRAVVDQVSSLLGYLYNDMFTGVWRRKLLFHGLYTLAEVPGTTFLDIVPLLQPTNQEEKAWADYIISNVKDREIKRFWNDWRKFNEKEQDVYMQPLVNRIWQLTNRSEVRNTIGQSKSAFKMEDVLSGNKILLINLSGLPDETKTLLGTLLVNALWTAAQSLKPNKPNFLFLDEFQLMTRLPTGLDDMLARARKHNLGLVMGTQYISDVAPELQNAVINNAGSRIIFRSSAKEARLWLSEFGRQFVGENDFVRIPQHEALAQLTTKDGVGTPISIGLYETIPGIRKTGLDRQVLALSSEKHGRPIDEVERDIYERNAPQVKRSRRPQVGRRKIKE